MRRVALTLLLAAGSLGAGGCAQTFDATTLGVPVTMANNINQPAAGQAFSVTTHSVHGFWGLVTLKEPSVERILAGQLMAGTGISDARIKVRSSFTDILFTVLTAGIIAPRSVTVEGVVTGP